MHDAGWPFCPLSGVNFRKRTDGLAAIVQAEFDLDPFFGAIFRAKRADLLKIIVWMELGGYWFENASKAQVFLDLRSAMRDFPHLIAIRSALRGIELDSGENPRATEACANLDVQSRLLADRIYSVFRLIGFIFAPRKKL
ncbi:IS66 family insertion sequence element accessory protein TnpB [Paenirhodobacter sp.]|uniref:IS66 family insertion sequence element accessory protein TnpB n=1 Tax=Paenirhodobacter sp. TaxID=1965326 RepID=UPI003B3F3F0D